MRVRKCYIHENNFNELANSVLGISLEEPLRAINDPSKAAFRESTLMFTSSRRPLYRNFLPNARSPANDLKQGKVRANIRKGGA